MWWVVLGGLCSLYGAGLFAMKYMKNERLWNGVFVFFTYLFYGYLVAYFYFDVGVKDWNFLNTLPTANVSPFMFFFSPFILFSPKKIRKYLFTLISLLSVGMALSTIVGCLGNCVANYKIHVHFIADCIAHILLSLWGIYLIKTKQTSISKKNCLVASAVIFGVALTMMGLNLLFDTAFFGLSLRGKHNIYNNVLVSSSYLSAFLYFLGLGIVLLLGFALQKLLLLKVWNKRKKKGE
jgi:hypothetical protein